MDFWFHHRFKPPRQWVIAVLLLSGIFWGLVIFIFHISRASSYLSSDSKTCINCHVMIPQYATWQRSSHREAAKCIDCHIPHDSVLRKYAFKIKDGTRHAAIFTMHGEPQVIRIKEEGAGVVQENCIRCHTSILQDASLVHADYSNVEHGQAKLCWDCHREVPHGLVRSLSATPYVIGVEHDKSKLALLRELHTYLKSILKKGQP